MGGIKTGNSHGSLSGAGKHPCLIGTGAEEQVEPRKKGRKSGVVFSYHYDPISYHQTTTKNFCWARIQAYGK